MATKFSALSIDDRSNLAFLQTEVWAPARTEDYAADCEHGRSIGIELVDMVQASGNPTLIPTTARMIMAAGKWGGVEIGLFSMIGCQLL